MAKTDSPPPYSGRITSQVRRRAGSHYQFAGLISPFSSSTSPQKSQVQQNGDRDAETDVELRISVQTCRLPQSYVPCDEDCYCRNTSSPSESSSELSDSQPEDDAYTYPRNNHVTSLPSDAVRFSHQRPRCMVRMTSAAAVMWPIRLDRIRFGGVGLGRLYQTEYGLPADTPS
jgi:hypothetical protein